jgi:hypothetical protein
MAFRQNIVVFLFSLDFLFRLLRGDSHPELGAQRTDEGGGFFLFMEEMRTEGPLDGIPQFCLSLS